MKRLSYAILATDLNTCEHAKFDSFFSLSHTRDKTENIFLYLFTELNTCLLSYSIYKHDAIDIADPSSLQNVCHT